MSAQGVTLVHAVFERAAYRAEDLPAFDVPEIVFSGRSNVGKSSMLNRLAGRKALARVSSVPGKTVSVNFYRCDDFRLVDLPGYGYAKAAHGEKEQWSALVEHYLVGRPVALAVQLIDARRAPTQDDAQMLAFFAQNNVPFVAAMTKMDKMGPTEQAARRAAFGAETGLPEARIIPFSARTGEDVQALTAAIEAALGKNK